MAREVHDLLAQAELLENGPHGSFLGVDVLHGFGVAFVEVGDKLEQFLEAPFLKQPHQTFVRRKGKLYSDYFKTTPSKMKITLQHSKSKTFPSTVSSTFLFSLFDWPLAA